VLTLIGYGLLAVLVAVGLFLLAAWLLPAGEQIAPVIRDEPIWQLPVEQRLDADAVASVKLPVAIRGYRFAETDLLLDRLGEELRARDEEIARLRSELEGQQPVLEGEAPETEAEPSQTEAEPSQTEAETPQTETEAETTHTEAEAETPHTKAEAPETDAGTLPESSADELPADEAASRHPVR
jgi:hypothetical protein